MSTCKFPADFSSQAKVRFTHGPMTSVAPAAETTVEAAIWHIIVEHPASPQSITTQAQAAASQYGQVEVDVPQG